MLPPSCPCVITEVESHTHKHTESFEKLVAELWEVIKCSQSWKKQKENLFSSFSLPLSSQTWSGPERLLALDELIDSCETGQVKHMMQVIEPQFQRDFISLLPKEVQGSRAWQSGAAVSDGT